MTSSILPVAIVLPPWLAALFTAMVALRRPALARAIVLTASLVSLAAAVAALVGVAHGATLLHEFGGWSAPLGIVFRMDGLSATMALLITVVSVAVFVYAGPNLAAELPGKESAFLAAASLLSAALLGMSVTGDLFNLYVFLEIASITGYTLIAARDAAGAYASFRYLLIGSVGATFYLVGLAFLLAMTGTLNMADMAARLPAVASSPATLVGFAFIVAGFGLKMAMFPMHAWLPDAYTYAPSTATALIAALMTKVGAYALIRVTYGVVWPAIGPLALPLTPLLGTLASLGILAGSFMAIAQRDFKRLLAFSSVSHVGYITLGLSLGNANGLLGAMLHILGHGLMKGCLFLIAGAAGQRTQSGAETSFDHLSRRMPLSMGAFVVVSMSMIGIPPTIGFFSKWYLLLGCLDGGHYLFAAVLLISTWLNAWYFFRLIERTYFGASDEHDEEKAASPEAPGAMLAPILALALAIVLAGVGSYPLVRDVLRPSIDALPVSSCPAGMPCNLSAEHLPGAADRGAS